MSNIVQLPRPRNDTQMWHVVLTVAGTPVSSDTIQRGLENLAHDHPFLLSGRFASDRAEIRYWEEADSVSTVIELAMHLWSDHQETSGLPSWRVVGVEVVDRETFHRRGTAGLVSAGGIGPFSSL